MKRFSPEGSWWWDGGRWVLASEIHLIVPETEFERSGKLKTARRMMAARDWAFAGFYVAGASVVGIPLIPILVIVFVVVQYRAFNGYPRVDARADGAGHRPAARWRRADAGRGDDAAGSVRLLA